MITSFVLLIFYIFNYSLSSSTNAFLVITTPRTIIQGNSRRDRFCRTISIFKSLTHNPSRVHIEVKNAAAENLDDDNGSNDDDTEFSIPSNSSQSIRFLGKGTNAIVRLGVVLLAPAEEYHHFLRQSAVYIYAMGENNDGDYVIRGVIIDHPTPFTIGEMMMPMKPTTGGGIYDNLVFRGGDTGPKDESEGAFCIHTYSELGKEEIGTSGIYQGGDLNMLSNPDNVKFFFNYMEFTEDELEQMLEVTHGDGDAWCAVEVPPQLVLSSEYDRGDAWRKLRNAIAIQIQNNR